MRRGKRLSRTQSVCIMLLWLALCYWILTGTERIDGPLILMLVLSAKPYPEVQPEELIADA